MMFIPLEDAQTRLQEILDGMPAGEERFLTVNDRVVARLIKTLPPSTEPIELGTMAGSVLYMSPDFNDPMEFKE